MGKKKQKREANSNSSGTGVEKALVENFISLQRVMVNLSSRFDNLANEISKLLELFEISAKALAEKNFSISGDKGNEKIIQKIDTLLDQNKIIAKGLTLMHESNIRQPSGYQQQMPMTGQSAPGQSFPGQPPRQPAMEGYQKSIGSEDNPNAGFDTPIPPKERKFRKLPSG